MNKKDFINYAEKIQQVEEFARCCRGVESFAEIQWEMDPQKMNFKALASGAFFPDRCLNHKETIMHVETVPISRVVTDCKFDLKGDPTRYIPLYKLINNGDKIIPPMVHLPYHIINGESCRTNMPALFQVSDGNHRVALARALNLKAIPVLFVETCSGYTFDRPLWDADLIGDTIVFNNKNDKREYSIDLSIVNPDYGITSRWCFNSYWH